jgi:antirestriction protein
MTTQTQLVGDDLLAYVDANKTLSKAELVLGAGYSSTDGKPSYTRFYEELLKAKGDALPSLANEPFNPKDVLDNNPHHGVYIACLASYNNGILYGHWVDLDLITDKEELTTTIDYILKHSPTVGAEEYACNDWVGIPSFLADEYPNWDDVFEYLTVIQEVSDEDAYKYACECHDSVLSKRDFNSTFMGCYSSVEEFCMEFTDNMIEINYLVNYVDWDRVWHGEYQCNGWREERPPGLGGQSYIFAPI